MFSYQKIVFGIKNRFQISEVLKIFKQQRSFSFLISQHNAIDQDYCCDRPDVHYHGVVEFINVEGRVENFLIQLSHYCIYINADYCSNPVEYLAYIIVAPKRSIAQEFLASSKLLDYLRTASNMRLEVLKRKIEKRASLIKQNICIILLVDTFLKSGYHGNKLSQVEKNEAIWAPFQKWMDENNETTRDISPKIVETASSVSKKIVLSSSILTLSCRFEIQNGYLSPEESVHFVLNWCSFQKLDPKELVRNLIRCLDKKGGNRNSIYLQGAGNSGKSYIVQSIVEACIYVGQVVVESSAYSFVWEKCVDKRLIVLMEPHFSIKNYEQLDSILSGSGTLIYKHNDDVDYLQPTPVIILANEQVLTDAPNLREKIKKRFLGCYMDLKYFPYMSEKKLHPQWLNLLHKTFSSKSNSKAVEKNSGKEDSENSMESNPQHRKRALTDIGTDARGNKMNRVDENLDES